MLVIFNSYDHDKLDPLIVVRKWHHQCVKVAWIRRKRKQKCNEKTSQSSQEEEQPLEKRPKRKHNEDKSKKSQASQSSQEEEELSLTSNSQDSSYISECNIRTGKRARKNRNLSG